MFAESDGLQNLALLDSMTGTTLSTISLPNNDADVSVLFNDVRNQAVALSGNTAYVVAENNDRLEIEYIIDTSLRAAGGFAQAISNNGRFLITYGGMTIENPPNTKSTYVSYDLEKRTAQEFFFSGRFAAMNQKMTFHRASDTLLVPLHVRIKDSEETLKVILSGSRQTDIITLSADGVLSRPIGVEIPEQSADETQPNLTYIVNNTQVSTSGALGLVASGNGRVFSFDTMTGEIVNDEKNNTRLFQIYMLEPLGLLAYGRGDNKLYITDISTAPVVTTVKVKKKTTLIKGANFLSGVKVKVNGVEVTNAERNVANLGREIILNLGKKDFPTGQDVVITVVNRDGLSSKPFSAK